MLGGNSSRPFAVFKAEDTFLIQNIGESPSQAHRLMSTMEINQQPAFSRGLRTPPIKVNHFLVVTIHKIYFDSLNSDSLKIVQSSIHLLIQRIPHAPQDDAYFFRFSISHHFFEIQLRINFKEISRVRPAFIKNYIFKTIS